MSIFSAIIVTGGQVHRSATTSVEILKVDGSPICKLNSLPEARKYHSQSGLTACGGIGGASRSCVTFKKGVWTKTHLSKDWVWHSSWFSNRHGTILMGGSRGTNKAAEKLSENGRLSQSFKLKYGLE